MITRKSIRRHFLMVCASTIAVGCVTGAALGSAAHRRPRHPHPQARTAHTHARTVVVPVGAKGGANDPGDDYPIALKRLAQDAVVDQWGMFNRECVSFVAWALASRNGYNMPFHANAVDWARLAGARNIRVDHSPAAGAVAWSKAGHVAYVQDVLGDGRVHVEEYNYDYHGHYNSRVVSASAFSGYIHFRDRAPVTVPAPTPAVDPAPAQQTPAITLQGSNGTSLQGSQVPVQGSSGTSLQGGGSTGGGAPSQPTPVQPTPGQPTPVSAPPPTWTEQVWSSVGVGSFLGYHNASGPGPRLASGQYVQVSCKVYDPTIASVMPGGYWYRLASAPFNNQYYSPANSFWNGDIPGQLPYTHSVDYAVPDC